MLVVADLYTDCVKLGVKPEDLLNNKKMKRFKEAWITYAYNYALTRYVGVANVVVNGDKEFDAVKDYPEKETEAEFDIWLSSHNAVRLEDY